MEDLNKIDKEINKIDVEINKLKRKRDEVEQTYEEEIREYLKDCCIYEVLIKFKNQNIDSKYFLNFSDAYNNKLKRLETYKKFPTHKFEIHALHVDQIQTKILKNLLK